MKVFVNIFELQGRDLTPLSEAQKGPISLRERCLIGDPVATLHATNPGRAAPAMPRNARLGAYTRAIFGTLLRSVPHYTRERPQGLSRSDGCFATFIF